MYGLGFPQEGAGAPVCLAKEDSHEKPGFLVRPNPGPQGYFPYITEHTRNRIHQPLSRFFFGGLSIKN